MEAARKCSAGRAHHWARFRTDWRLTASVPSSFQRWTNQIQNDVSFLQGIHANQTRRGGPGDPGRSDTGLVSGMICDVCMRPVWTGKVSPARTCIVRYTWSLARSHSPIYDRYTLNQIAEQLNDPKTEHLFKNPADVGREFTKGMHQTTTHVTESHISRFLTQDNVRSFLQTVFPPEDARHPIIK